MVTLTARHGRDDDLLDLVTRLKGRGANKKKGIEAFRGAKQRLVGDRRYKEAVRPFLVGSVTATELTGGGANGWHPHMHMILILTEDIDLSPMREAWLGALKGAGLEGTGAGWDVREADETGKYLGKWGAAEELALSGHKKGRAGRTPSQLLAASSDDADSRAGDLWSEYARVFRGRRQLVWSNKLKDRVGIKEIADEEAAKDKEQPDQVETGRSNIAHQPWKGNVASRRGDRRAEICEIAESEGADAAAAAAMAGPDPDIHGVGDFIDVIEEMEHDHQPVAGGLGARALSLVSEPDRKGIGL
jgi:hypothetical protein